MAITVNLCYTGRSRLVSRSAGSAASSRFLLFFGRLVGRSAGSAAGCRRRQVPVCQILKSHEFVLLVVFGRAFRNPIVKPFSGLHKYAPFCNYPVIKR